MDKLALCRDAPIGEVNPTKAPVESACVAVEIAFTILVNR